MVYVRVQVVVSVLMRGPEEQRDLCVGSSLAKQLEVNQIDTISNGLVLEQSKVNDENNCTKHVPMFLDSHWRSCSILH